MNLWPFHRSVPRYDHAEQIALVDAMAKQVPSPASIPAVQPATQLSGDSGRFAA